MNNPTKLSIGLIMTTIGLFFLGNLANADITDTSFTDANGNHDHSSPGMGMTDSNETSVEDPEQEPNLVIYSNPDGATISGDSSFGEIKINNSTLNAVTRRNIPATNSSDPNSPNYDPNATETDASGSAGEIPGDAGEIPDEFESLSANQPREVSINDVAKLLETDLNQSLEQLATIESAVETAEEAPRRIARRRNLEDEDKACVNPAIQARKTVAEKLEQSQNFIERVNQINPNNGLW